MSDYSSLILKKFNPCADRLLLIEKNLLCELNDLEQRELLDHIESCKRCRRYQGYLIAVEKGFSFVEDCSGEISSANSSKLPLNLKIEMNEAMKRNLSKWLHEVARIVMYKRGFHNRFLYDQNDLSPIDESFINAKNIFNSLKITDISYISKLESYKYLINLFLSENPSLHLIDPTSLKYLFSICLEIYKYNIFCIFNYFLLSCYLKDNESSQILLNALRTKPTSLIESHIYNDLGCFFYSSGDHKKAIDNFLKSISLYNYSSPHLNLCFSYLEINDTIRSIHHFNEAYNLIHKIGSNKLRNERLNSLSFILSYHKQRYKNQIESNNLLCAIFNKVY